MKTPHDGELPAMSSEVRFAMSSLRDRGPSDGFMERVRDGLQQAQREALPETVEPPFWQRLIGRTVLAGSAALCSAAVTLAAVGVLSVDERTGGGGSVVMEVPFPEGGESVWLHLPSVLGSVHATSPHVFFETPHDVEVDTHDAHAPSMVSACSGDRCVHSWVHTETAARHTPVMVRLPRPGQYEFHLTSVSGEQHLSEHFVVSARD